MSQVFRVIAYTVLFCTLIFSVATTKYYYDARHTARRIEAKLDTVLTINQRSTHEINQIRTQLDTVYRSISDAELLNRTKAINHGYRPYQR